MGNVGSYKLVGAGLIIAAGMMIGLGTLVSPITLERFVLTEGGLNSDLTRWTLHATSVGLIAAAITSCIAARWTLTRGRQKSDAWLGARLIAAAIGLALAFGVGEVASRVLLDWDQVVSGDDLWRYRFARRQGREDSRYPMDQFDAQLGWTLAPYYRSDGVNTNSRGVRGLSEYSQVKPSGVQRIVVIGDSFTFGENVTDDEAYPARLESLLPKTEVINLGVHGYGLGQMHLRLLSSGFDYQPDLVVVGVYSNDFYRAVLSFRGFAKPRYAIINGQLTLTNTPIAPPNEYPIGTAESHLPRSYFLGAADRMVRRYVNRSRFAPQWELGRRILDATMEACQAHQTRVLVVGIPTTAMGEPRHTGKMLDAWAASRGTPYLNLAETFTVKSERDRSRLYKGHWTPFGHQVGAEAIAEFIETHGLLSAKGDAAGAP